jgi:putative phosphoesterase
MKKIAVFSDMHIPTSLASFPMEGVIPHMDGVGLLFGLGDYVTRESFDVLYSFGIPVYCVAGNMDDQTVKSQLPAKLTLRIEDVDIGLIHGWGGSFRIREKLIKEFEGINLVCYGHTHEAFTGNLNDVLFFNPGSVCGSNGSFGIIEIDGINIKPAIIRLPGR